MKDLVVDLLVRDVELLLTMQPELGHGELGELPQATLAFDGGELVYLGDSASAPRGREEISGEGCIGLPGLVDCHTHSLFAGSRSDEFRRRLAGEDYTAILQAGGGILSTVRHTRAARDEQLADLLRQRLEGMRALGVTTVEVKTGYALSREQELRCLALLRGGDWPVRVSPTWLGAHAVPAEWRHDRAGYLRELLEMAPEAATLADAVDVYCDRGAFDLREARAVLEAGMSQGLVGRMHAEQVAHTGAAALAAELGCRSADHLERVDAAGIAAMARAGTVGVMLPGAMLYLRDPCPPAQALSAAGVPLAIATDFNPGTSPVRDLWTCATLACVTLRLTVEQTLLGITKNAGLALGRPELGRLGPGCAADLVLVKPPPGEPVLAASLVQYMGGHRAHALVQDGRLSLS